MNPMTSESVAAAKPSAELASFLRDNKAAIDGFCHLLGLSKSTDTNTGEDDFSRFLELRSLHEQLTASRAECQGLRREIAILELKNRSSLANNLCPDHRDKQQGKPCLACEIERLSNRLALAEKSEKQA